MKTEFLCCSCYRAIKISDNYYVVADNKYMCSHCKKFHNPSKADDSFYTKQRIECVEWKFYTKGLRLYLPLKLYGFLTYRHWEAPLRYAVDDMGQTWLNDSFGGPLNVIPPSSFLDIMSDKESFKNPLSQEKIMEAYTIISCWPVRYYIGCTFHLGDSVSAKDLPRYNSKPWNPDCVHNDVVTILDAPWYPKQTYRLINFQHLQNKTELEVYYVAPKIHTPTYA